jgi:hypothetical protein
MAASPLSPARGVSVAIRCLEHFQNLHRGDMNPVYREFEPL